MSLVSPLVSGRTAALLALTVLAACGGSGGGPTVVGLGNATLSGPYFAIFVSGENGPPPRAEGTTGSGTSDGAGHVPLSLTTNQMGVVTGPLSVPFEYTVLGDGTLAIGVPVAEVARGGVSADGACGLVGANAGGTTPAVMALLRRAGSYSNASLTGAYRLVAFGTSTSGSTVGITGPVTADGAGSVSGAAVTANLMGAVGSFPFTATYAVLPDGTAQIDTSTPETFAGGVVKGGAVAVFGGAVSGDDGPGMLVLVRGASGASNATFRGAYWVVTIARDAVTGDFRSQWGTVTTDGAGNLTLTAVANLEGTFSTVPPQAATYSVAANGTLTVIGGGNTMVGAVTQDGSFAVAGGGTNAGSDPILVLLCKK